MAYYIGFFVALNERWRNLLAVLLHYIKWMYNTEPSLAWYGADVIHWVVCCIIWKLHILLKPLLPYIEVWYSMKPSVVLTFRWRITLSLMLYYMWITYYIELFIRLYEGDVLYWDFCCTIWKRRIMWRLVLHSVEGT